MMQDTRSSALLNPVLCSVSYSPREDSSLAGPAEADSSPGPAGRSYHRRTGLVGSPT